MGTDPNRQGNSRRWIRMEVENSLRRLQTDWIDLYQIHRPDPTLDVDETLGVLTDLVREGKVRAIGSSTFPAEQIVEAQWVAERRNRERFRCEQPPYSILARHRALGAADVRALRHGRDRVEPAQRRLAQRQVPARSGVAGRQPRRDGHVLRAREEAQPAQVRRGRATREGRRRCRPVDDAPRDRVEPRAPGGDVDDHRPEDDGAAHRSPRRRRRAPRCGRSIASTRSSLRA